LNGICPIGWTFAGQQARIADQDFNIVSKNQAGELFLAGSQVNAGTGMIQRRRERSLCEWHFEDTIWYRTGDLVKQGSTGCMYYLGRIDDQVKIRRVSGRIARN